MAEPYKIWRGIELFRIDRDEFIAEYELPGITIEDIQGLIGPPFENDPLYYRCYLLTAEQIGVLQAKWDLPFDATAVECYLSCFSVSANEGA